MDHEPAETLAGPRVTLDRRTAADVPAVHRLVSEALPHLRPWMSWASGYDLDAARAALVRSDDGWTTGTAYVYAIRNGFGLVGMCELWHLPSGDGMELGYWLHPAHTGKGLATEAAGLLVEVAFAKPEITVIEICHDAANVASSGVPRRLGFTEVERRTPAREPRTPSEVGIDVVWRRTRSRHIDGCCVVGE